MNDTQQDYRSYLLRLYRVHTGEATSWRASLQSTQGDRWHHFGSLSELFSFLEQEDDLEKGVVEEDDMDSG